MFHNYFSLKFVNQKKAKAVKAKAAFVEDSLMSEEALKMLGGGTYTLISRQPFDPRIVHQNHGLNRKTHATEYNIA